MRHPNVSFLARPSRQICSVFSYGVLNSRLSAGRPQGGGGAPRPIPICSRGAGVGVRAPAGDTRR